MRAMFPTSCKKHGFTLIEMTLTLVILGILAAVSLPKFFNQDTFDERFFHDDLISAVRYAQRLAIGSGCAVSLSVSGSGFSLLQDSNCDLSSPSYSLTVNRPSDSIAFSNADVPADLTITSSDSVFYFLPSGGAVDGTGTSVGSASISLAGGITRIIYIEGDTGYAYSS